MNWGLFESFCEMLEGIPIKAVLRAADAERRMVEDDLKKKRAEPDEGVRSVLGFCNFLTLAVRGIYASLASLPSEHRAFYARIVQQLVDAGELPSEIKGHLGQIFSPDKREALRSVSSETSGSFA
ncbi:MAG TPA: hypothetical protein VG938_06765 [Verrucomicrobiae bacterium]|jgi:hypothetical protein|nr:hypothetical protein [Verrucomicrobiae bacterium]